jgi:hypothetical protein
VRIFGSDASSTGVLVQPTVALADGNAILQVRAFDGTQRLRVENNNLVTVNSGFAVNGASALSGNVSVGGDVTVGGADLNIAKSGGASLLRFQSAGGSNNDPGRIEHSESGNTGELWIASSDDWDGVSAADSINFGERRRNLPIHKFDSAGNAEHTGDLTVGDDLFVGGAVSSGCPAGTAFVSGWCIDASRSHAAAVETWGQAMTFCNSQGKGLCPYDALMACDELNPSGSNCTADTADSGRVLWTGTRHSNRETDFDEPYQDNLMCYVGGSRHVDECSAGERHDYYCCTHAYPGTR